MKKKLTLLLVLLSALVLKLSLPGYCELAVGQAAPDFKLEGSDGKTYTLSQFKGKKAVVIAWFPKAFTGGCTTECRSIHEHAGQINHYDVAYFTASVDDAASNKKFAESLGATYPILSDPTKKTATAYGVLGALPFARRWTFYIGKDGKILAVDQNVKPATSAEDILSTMDRLGIPKK